MLFIKGVKTPLNEDTRDVLRGTTLEIYRFLVTQNKPVGIREVQRALNFSSPSVVTYHFSKLEEAGLVKHEQGGYVLCKLALTHSVRISRFIVPKHLFNATFAFFVLLIELTIFRPVIISREYFFSTIATLTFTIIFCYEALKAWQNKEL